MPRSIYSPSETSDWLVCPVRRQLKRAWTPREAEWSPAKLLGIAVQEGYNLFLRGDEDRIVLDVPRIITNGFEEQSRYTREGLVKLSLKGIQALVDADPFARHTILMIDEPLSSSRPDVVSRHETEGLGVTDFKVSQRVDERYRGARLAAYETDDQMWHYDWEVSSTLGEDVKWLRVIQVILTPKAVVLPVTWRPNPERRAFWLQGAEQHWQDMAAEDRGERPVVPNWKGCHNSKFVCEFVDACHVFNRDPKRMEAYYERTV